MKTEEAIRYVIGDATLPPADAPSIIAHICNDIGGWGRGFVLPLARRYPETEARYRAWHRGDEVDAPPFELGQVQIVQVGDDRWVANLIGQHDIRRKSADPDYRPIRYDAVRQGLRTVAEFARRHDAVAHMPRIGCGLAGGRWEEIEPIIQEELIAAGVNVVVYDLPA